MLNSLLCIDGKVGNRRVNMSEHAVGLGGSGIFECDRASES